MTHPDCFLCPVCEDDQALATEERDGFECCASCAQTWDDCHSPAPLHDCDGCGKRNADADEVFCSRCKNAEAVRS